MNISARSINLIRKYKLLLGAGALALVIGAGSVVSAVRYQVAADESTTELNDELTNIAWQTTAAKNDDGVANELFTVSDITASEDNVKEPTPTTTGSTVSNPVDDRSDEEINNAFTHYLSRPIRSVWNNFWDDDQEDETPASSKQSTETTTAVTTDKSQIKSANTVGKVRVVKTAWRWEYDKDKTNSPVLVPLYNLRYLDPVGHANDETQTTSAQYAAILGVTKNLPGLSNVKIAARCPDTGLSIGTLTASTLPPKNTDSNGFVEFSLTDAQQVGCEKIDYLTVSLADYGTPNKNESNYNYYFSEREKAVKSIPIGQNYAGTVFIAYRPTVAGQITDENGKPLKGVSVCLFYRQPSVDEPCDQEGLSINNQSNESGRYAIYASWGDYVQKGGGKEATLVIENNGKRQVCAEKFAIMGTKATIFNCKLTNEPTVTSLSQPELRAYRDVSLSRPSSSCKNGLAQQAPPVFGPPITAANSLVKFNYLINRITGGYINIGTATMTKPVSQDCPTTKTVPEPDCAAIKAELKRLQDLSYSYYDLSVDFINLKRLQRDHYFEQYILIKERLNTLNQKYEHQHCQ